jgi:hypothetical protein
MRWEMGEEASCVSGEMGEQTGKKCRPKMSAIPLVIRSCMMDMLTERHLTLIKTTF